MGNRQVMLILCVPLFSGRPALPRLPPLGKGFMLPLALRDHPLSDAQLKGHVLQREVQGMFQNIMMGALAGVQRRLHTQYKIVKLQPARILLELLECPLKESLFFGIQAVQVDSQVRF